MHVKPRRRLGLIHAVRGSRVPLRFGNIHLPDSKRVYVRLRKIDRRLQVLLAPFAELLRLLSRQWPISLVWLGLSFCCLLPGLAAQQTSEALLEYANAAESAGAL
jgi:hypothetical protein